MADKNRRALSSVSPERMLLDGSFAPNGTGAVAAASTLGAGFVVTRTGVGLFTIQFDQAYVLPLSSITLSVAQSPAAASYAVLVTAANNATGLLLTIQVYTANAAADIAAAATNRVSFQAFARKLTGGL